MNDIEEKNPKQVLLDWVTNVSRAAYRAKQLLHTTGKDSLDLASDEIGRIIGMCEAMSVVLENSN